MFVRSLARASTLFGALVGGAARAPDDSARTPPRRSSRAAAVTAAVPNINDPPVAINLRELGVDSRRAAVGRSTPSSLEILVNGQTGRRPGGRPVPEQRSGTRLHRHRQPGFHASAPARRSACASAVTNLAGDRRRPRDRADHQHAGPGRGHARPKQAACDDRNTPPVANAGPDRTVDDTDGAAGRDRHARRLRLDRSRPGQRAHLSRGSTSTTTRSLGPPSASPTLTVDPRCRARTTISLQRQRRQRRHGTSFDDDDVRSPSTRRRSRRRTPARTRPSRQRRRAGRERHARRLGFDRHRRHDRLVRVVPRHRRRNIGTARHRPDAHRHAARRRQRHRAASSRTTPATGLRHAS